MLHVRAGTWEQAYWLPSYHPSWLPSYHPSWLPSYHPGTWEQASMAPWLGVGLGSGLGSNRGRGRARCRASVRTARIGHLVITPPLGVDGAVVAAQGRRAAAVTQPRGA